MGSGGAAPAPAAEPRLWEPSTWRQSQRIVAVLAAVALAVVAVVIFVFSIEHLYLDSLDWMAAHPFLGSLVVVVITTLGTVLLVPGMVLWAAAGGRSCSVLQGSAVGLMRALCVTIGFAVKPVFLAIVLAIAGSTVGMALAFWIGRRYLHAVVQEEIQVRDISPTHSIADVAALC